ncbi:MAG: tetratricopeptide repeat protein, partial [Longimicrobiales bacterium]
MDDLLKRALALGDEGRWEEMARELADALQDDPEDPYLLCWLGVAERELDNDGAAYEYFRRCLAQEPLDPHLLAMCGSGLAAFDDPAAGDALRAAALTGGEVPETRLQYGAYLARQGLFTDALEQLEAAKRLAPEDADVHAELAIAHALKGDIASATPHMETALELSADDAWNRILLGLFHVELGDLEPAAEELWRAAEIAEADAEAQVLAALAAAAV